MSFAENIASLETLPDHKSSEPDPVYSSSLRFESYTATEQAAQHLKHLEADSAHCIYHCLDWISIYQATLGKSRNTSPLILVCFTGDTPVAALPFQISESMGVRTLSWLGQDFSNQNTGIWSDAALELDCTDLLMAELERLAEENRIDLVHLKNIPHFFQGKRHPLLADGGLVSPSPLFEGELSCSFDDIYRATHSSSARRQLRRKLELLSEIGPVTMKRALTKDELDRGTSAFFEQRAIREGDTGIPNVFDRDDSMAFVRKLLASGLGPNKQFTELWYLEVAGSVRATWLLGTRGRRLVGYANSIAHDETTQFSPGILLMKHIIEHACNNGDYNCLDLGLGEERYKVKWSEPVVLKDILQAHSTRGRRALQMQALLQSVKRWIRGSKPLWRLVRKVRKIKANLRRA